MRLFVGVTDWNWWSLHASKLCVEEGNFWRRSTAATFHALNAGELFLFKLHSPRNTIAGGGFFTRFVSLPVSLHGRRSAEGMALSPWMRCGQGLAFTGVPQSQLRFRTLFSVSA
jgi:hypothetical protein